MIIALQYRDIKRGALELALERGMAGTGRVGTGRGPLPGAAVIDRPRPRLV